MATRYIYLSDELNNRLKKEENASGLISQLLENHYKFNANSLDEKRKLLKDLEREHEKEVEILEQEREKFEKQIQTEEMKELIKKEMDEKQKTKVDQFKINVMENFKEEMKREMTENEYSSFKGLWDNNLTEGIYDFIKTLKDQERK